MRRIANFIADRFGDRRHLVQALDQVARQAALNSRRCAELHNRLSEWHATGNGLELKMKLDHARKQLESARSQALRYHNAYVGLTLRIEAYREALSYYADRYDDCGMRARRLLAELN
jgi:hypothetical protein